MYRAVVVNIAQAPIFKRARFLGRGIIVGEDYMDPNEVVGLSLLLGHLPEWRDEYWEYMGMEYVLLKHEHRIIASGSIKRITRITHITRMFLSEPTPPGRNYRYEFVCRDARQEDFGINPKLVYVRWDPVERCIEH